MTKLSDTQTIILSAAAQRSDGNVLTLPGSLRGGAAGKVVTSLLSRGLIAEQVADSMAKADPALNRVWRNEADGRGLRESPRWLTKTIFFTGAAVLPPRLSSLAPGHAASVSSGHGF